MENLWIINNIDSTKKSDSLFKFLKKNCNDLIKLSNGKLTCDVKEKHSVFDSFSRMAIDPFVPCSGIDIGKNNGVKSYFFNIATKDYDYYFTIFSFEVGDTFPVKVSIDSDIAKELGEFSREVVFDNLQLFEQLFRRVIRSSKVTDMVNRLYFLSSKIEIEKLRKKEK